MIKKFLTVLSIVSLNITVNAQDIEALETLTDDTIRSACHGYLIDMLPEAWRGDAYAATERCDPNFVENDNAPDQKKNMSGGNDVQLGTRIDPYIDITIECDSEYMCMQQRVKWRDAGNPISKTQYEQVEQHCEGRYGCIEDFFNDWPQPIPVVKTKPISSGLSFAELMQDEQSTDKPTFGAISNKGVNSASAFSSLVADRKQKALIAEGNSGYREILDNINKKSLLTKLKQQCGSFKAGYRTPASPRSIREDMRYMQDEFEEFSNCYSKTVPNWDANSYQLALNDFNQDSDLLAENFGVDISKQKKPKTIDQQYAEMQNELNNSAEKLRDKLEEGPDWIESLYASGTFKRPNSGPSAMQIFSQVLAQTNQDLARQNQANQQAFNNLIKNISVPKFTAPKTPTVANNVSVPNISAPVATVNKPTLSNPILNKQNSLSSFACFAPRIQVCIHYKMPEEHLKAYRDRCAGEGSQVLVNCPANITVSCQYSNFAGSITMNNYSKDDDATLNKKAQHCNELSGQFSKY